ncbi:MAG: UvrD-helicase domain-containing protein [Thermodesulfobacteriota bacterium]
MIERVKASAGSGKTHRLTERFVALLLSSSDAAPPAACGRAPAPDGPAGYDASGILAITFTNKAATEMKARVVEALKTLALSRPVDPEGVRRAAKAARELTMLLRHTGRLNVRTIDSLLALLLRLFSLDMGLCPDFESVFDTGRLFDPLLERLLGALDAGDREAADLFARAADALTEAGQGGFLPRQAVIGRLRQVFDHLAVSDTPRPDAGADDIHQAAARQSAALAQTAETLRDHLDAAGAEPVSQYAKLLARTAALSPLATPPESAYAAKKDVADCLKKSSRVLATPELAALHDAFRALHAQASADQPLLADALSFLPFTELAGRLVAGLPEMIREQGLLPSALWTAKADLALREGGVPEAWCRMGARLLHLLIDEFQDTSVGQWAVLELLAAECLAKGGGLFYVGDVKQAIYGWRGGQAALFDRAAADSGLDRLAGVRDETLPCNWRSARHVVEFNNRFFGLLADPGNASLAAWALLHKAPDAIRAELSARLGRAFAGCAQALPPDREIPPGRVTVRRLDGENAAGYAEAARQACLDLLSTDLLPRLGPSGAAILTRTNDQAALVSRWLVAAGIPVVTENSLRLADHPLIQALLAFLAFVDYPADNLAFFEFLCSPGLFCEVSGLSPAALHDWAAGRTGRLSRDFAREYPDIWERLIRPFARQAGLTGPYDLIQELLAAWKVVERRPADEPFVRRFLEVLHLAEQRGISSITAFLAWWKEGGLEEKAPQAEHIQAVRVMTVHKAKGLEFPAVIVPFHNFRVDPGTDFGRVGLNGKTALVPLSTSMGEAYQRRRAEACLEQINLVYVAWTRAELELHLFFPRPPFADKNPVTRAALALLEKMDVADDEVRFGPEPKAPAAPAWAPEACPPGSAGEHAAAAPEASGEIAPPLSWVMRLMVYRNSVRDLRDSLAFTEKKRGLAAHAAVEVLRRLDMADPAAPLAAARAALARTECSPPEAGMIEHLARDIAAGLTWLLSLPDMPERLRSGLSERDILDEAGNKYRPDLMCLSPDETLVIDFKTGAPAPGHAAQVRRYLRLAAALPGHAAPARLAGLLVYLDRRETVAVSPE